MGFEGRPSIVCAVRHWNYVGRERNDMIDESAGPETHRHTGSWTRLEPLIPTFNVGVVV